MTTQDASWHAKISRIEDAPGPNTSLRLIMQRMTEMHLGLMPLAVEGRLYGILVDGDLRRAIVAGADLDGPAGSICNRDPITVEVAMTRDEVKTRLLALKKQFAPVVDSDRRVVGIISLDDVAAVPALDNPAVIFAGGFGKRLRPYTDALPKPMLPVGGVPIVMKVIESLVDHGINRLHLLLHYRPEAFESYFRNKTFRGRAANLVTEAAPRGTAGGLSLLRSELNLPFLLLNGDNIVKAEWADVLRDHEKSGASLTIGVADYQVTVPFGVLEAEGMEVRAVVEKPTYRWQTICSAYCLSPGALDLVPDIGHFDMPDLINGLLRSGKQVRYFRVSEYQRIEDLVASHDDIWRRHIDNLPGQEP